MEHSNNVFVFAAPGITDADDFQSIDIHYLVLKNLHTGILKGCENLIYAQKVFMVAGNEKNASSQGRGR